MKPTVEPVRLALRPPEAAAAIGVSLRTLMAMVAADEIPYRRINRRCLRFPVAQLESWLARREGGSGA